MNKRLRELNSSFTILQHDRSYGLDDIRLFLNTMEKNNNNSPEQVTITYFVGF